MITGTAKPEGLAASRPKMASLDTGPLSLPGATVLQAMFEMPQSAREAVVPPGLHPTNPAALVFVAWQCPESPWGPFSMVQARAQARSGTRPRGFVTGAWCSDAGAAEGLAQRFGFPTQTGDVRLVRGYDRVDLQVAAAGATVLDLVGADPDPLDPADVQYSVTMNLAQTPRGLRLVQVEPDYALSRAERIRPRIDCFDAASWGDDRLDPYFPVSASIAQADITLPALRFLCRPDVLAFEGTETV